MTTPRRSGATYTLTRTSKRCWKGSRGHKAPLSLEIGHERILGIDPGSLHTGYGLIERQGSSLLPIEAGRFSCPRDLALPERLGHLAGRLPDLLVPQVLDLGALA